jgi:putative flavoprotein involved in K+ transport
MIAPFTGVMDSETEAPPADGHSVPEGSLDGLHRPVVVIGGGQAGLSISHYLVERQIEHLVLERHSVGHEWRTRRWDSFCLVTPNRQCVLPGFPYAGTNPDGFMVRDEIVEYLESYTKSFGPPLIEGVGVTALQRSAQGGFSIGTTAGTLTADQVVIAAGPYHSPSIPRMGERLPSSILQLHSSQYRNPQQLPDGAVLVIGTGQSGCQIAEDLHLAGRQVHLATGTAPRVARFYRGRDCMTWLDEIGHYSKGIDEFADQQATRFKVNHYVTGRDGGRDIDLRAFARDGMQLYGRALAIINEFADSGPVLTFAADLAGNLDGADAVSESIKTMIDGYIAANGLDAPEEARYTPVWRPEDEPDVARDSLDLAAAGIGAVIWATGYRRDYRWVDLPIFDGSGYPTHERGVTSEPGLYVLGMPWQHTWGSGRFRGVGADAGYLIDQIADRLDAVAAARTTERQVA